ncbi:MGDG synthase family glycosyltransferase [Paenibacillus bouchesdurhonensis]|uniref:MGDG synthase family glycosyltransferase n=1 Tax=Paenibacillus bouchesdurhonensis TaxID=1870990 RepID=UPI000DA6287C|nr:glycosyltransferase [Paenibacillus bouchesdurhonensis]
MSSNSPKVLIMYASYGDGHYQASKALEASFHHSGITDVVLLDLMAEAHPFLNEMTKFVYMQSFKTIPLIYGWVYNATKDMQPDTSLLSVLNSLGMRKMQQAISSIEPDLIIHTFPQLAMPKLLKKTGLTLPLVNIVTDFDLHGRWVHPDVDRYYVATEDLKTEVVRRGIPAERVLASGIPLKPDFGHVSLAETEQICELEPSKKTILIMAGAFGVMQGIWDICEELLSNENYQVIAVCGRNKELHCKLKQELGRHPHFHLFGYINEVAQLMRLSNCIITKPGGITLSESLVCRLPIFLYRPVPGQELNNALYLERKGIASIASDPGALIEQIDALLRDEERLARIYQEIDNIRKPEAAEIIVKDIIEQWFTPASMLSSSHSLVL